MVEQYKRKIHAEVENATWVDCDGINSGLARLCKLADNSLYLEIILKNTIRNLFENLPNGQENYKGYDSKLGEVWTARAGDDTDEGNIRIWYTPSSIAKKQYGFNYIQTGIGEIILPDRTYWVRWEEDYKRRDLPKAIMQDTEEVMKVLCLRKVEKPNR